MIAFNIKFMTDISIAFIEDVMIFYMVIIHNDVTILNIKFNVTTISIS